jgi:hypothetical protein
MDEVKRYEEYQFKIAKSIVGKPPSEEGKYCLRKEFIPNYLIQRAASPIIKDLPLESILTQIVDCIHRELKYYEENKSGVPDFIATFKMQSNPRGGAGAQRPLPKRAAAVQNVNKVQGFKNAKHDSYQSDEEEEDDSLSDLTDEEAEDSVEVTVTNPDDFSQSNPPSQMSMVPPRTRLIPHSSSTSQERTPQQPVVAAQQQRGSSRVPSVDKVASTTKASRANSRHQ